MNYDDGHKYAHSIARNYQPQEYDDVYQQAWIYLLEAEENGVEGVDCFWDARMRTNLWVNYRNRLVSLPARTGSREIADAQEIEQEVQDHINPYRDHAEAYELRDEINLLKKNMLKLDDEEKKLLYDLYYREKSYRDLAKETGLSKSVLHKYHSQILDKLNRGQSPE